MTFFFIIFFAAFGIITFIFAKSLQIPKKLKKAEELLKHGKLTEAAAIVKSVLERQKDDVKAHYIRARILQEQKQYLLAIAELNSILNIADFHLYVPELSVRYALAEMYGATNNYQKQVEEYRLILNLNPDDVAANIRLGLVLYHKGDYKKAKDSLIRVINLEPKQTECLLPLGISLYHIGDYERAEEYLLRTLEHFPGNSEAEFYLGCIYKSKRAYDTAINMFNRSKENPSFYTSSLQQIGEIYFYQDKYETAINILEPGLISINDNTNEGCAYRYLLADCYEATGRIKDAIKTWEIIAKHIPDFRNTKANLEGYKTIVGDPNLMDVFSMTMEKLQGYISDIISGFDYNIISSEQLSSTDYVFKAYNIKRIGDPPVLIMFSRTAKEITDFDVNELYKRMMEEKCKNALFLTTSSFSPRAEALAPSRQIEIFDGQYFGKAFEKVKNRRIR